MKNSERICTESKETNGYDIAIIEGNSYTLYRSYKERNINVFDDDSYSFYLDRRSFDKRLKDLHLKKEYNLYGYDPDKWTCYYTSAVGSEDLVDQIEIDIKGKEYRLYKNEENYITDGYDEFGFPQFSSYVSRLVFDILVSGIKEKNFKLSDEE